MKRALRRGGGNAGDQPKQPIIPVLWPGAIQQVRLDDAFRDQSPNGAAEPLGGPGCRPAAVQDRTTSPQGWPGRMRRTVGSHASR